MSPWYEWREAPPLDFAVIGDPIAHSLSPRMFAAAGIPESYGAIRVSLNEFDEALNHLVKLGFRGLNVTLPLKEAAAAWCASKSDIAGRLGAVNTLRLSTREGINTDALGLVEVLRELGLQADEKVLLLGAGGTARAALYALSELGARITLWNRTPARAERLLSELSVNADLASTGDAESFRWVVNSTSSERGGEPLETNFSAEVPGVALDLNYAQAGTAWIARATCAGWRGVDGRSLLVEQGAASYHWWTGTQPNRDQMLASLQEALAP